MVEIIINYKINQNHGLSGEHPVKNRNDWFEFIMMTPTEHLKNINQSLASVGLIICYTM